MATKHGKVVTYLEGLPAINSHNPLNSWSLEKLKTIHLHYHNAYDHQTCQGGTILGGHPSINLPDHLMGWSCEVTRQNNTYLYFQKIHRPQTIQGADLLCEAPTLQAT